MSPPLPYVLGGFGTIVADPPWEYRAGKATRIKPPYPTMSTREIRELPIGALASTMALLFLWCTVGFRSEAVQICRAWGFRPVSEMIWVKLSERQRLQIGMGSYVRLCHEPVIIGERGGQTGLVRNVPSVFFAPRGAHSVKPDRFYSMVEPLAPRPRVDLFARRRRPGWHAWGDELPEEVGHGNGGDRHGRAAQETGTEIGDDDTRA